MNQLFVTVLNTSDEVEQVDIVNFHNLNLSDPSWEKPSRDRLANWFLFEYGENRWMGSFDKKDP